MALEFYSSIDLNKNELQNAVVQNAGSAPGSPAEGQIYYDSTSGDKAIHFYNGSAWVRLAGQVSAQTTDTIASGDFISFSDENETGDINNKLTVDNLFKTAPALLTEATLANGDYMLFLDGGATGETKKEALADVATLFAGAGMTATSSVLNVIAGDGITVAADAVAVTAAATTITSVLNTALKVGRDSTDLIDFSTDNAITLRIGNNNELTFDGTNFFPVSDTGMHLGKDGNAFKSLSLGDIDGDAAGAFIRFEKSRAGDTVTDADDIGKFAFFAMNDAGSAEEIEYSRWLVEALDNVDASETARSSLKFIADGALANGIKFTGQADGTLDVEIADGAASVTTIAGTLTMGSTAALDNAGQVVVAAQTEMTTITNAALKVGRDADNLLDFSTDNQITLRVGAADELVYTGTELYPSVNGGLHLGKDGNGFNDLHLQDIAAGANSSLIRFEKNRNNNGSAGVNGDDIGKVSFFSFNDAGTPELIEYARITAEIESIADASETGKQVFKVMADGAIATGFKIVGTATSGRVDAEIGAGAASVVTIPGNLVVTGTTTTNNVETVSTSSGVIFEGAAADGHDALLKSVVADSDKTYTLPNVAGHVALFAADPSTTTISSTPEELNKLDGATVVVGEINMLDLGSTAVGNAVASKVMVLDSDLDYTGVRNFTLSGELDAGSLDVSGDVDVDGTLETDALTIDGTAIVAQATASAVGGVELATAAEVLTGTDTARVVTADTLSAKSVVAIIDVSSLTDANIVTIPHNLGTADVMVQVYDATTEANIMCDIARTTDDFSTASTSSISIDFGTAPPNDCRCLITSLKGASASGTVAYT